jgi:hypothetical protein
MADTAEQLEPTPAKRNDAVQVMFDLLKDVPGFHKETFRAEFADLSDQEFGLALHDARERLRDELRIEFIPDHKGSYVRATEKQKVARMHQFRRTSVKKIKRSVRVGEAVITEDLPLNDRINFQRAKERHDRAAIQTEALLDLRKPLVNEPTVRPENPRRPRSPKK